MDFDVNEMIEKIPYLDYLSRSEFIPYFNTAGTVLLGWLIISWIWQVIRKKNIIFLLDNFIKYNY